MTLPFYIVEAFTTGNNKAYTGNPAGVCFLEFDDDISDLEKQGIANSINLSETAFVARAWTKGTPVADAAEGQLTRTIRWFSPTCEVPLCGHATLASSLALLYHLRKNDGNTAKIEQINFQTKVRGVLIASVENIKDREYIALNFPANDTEKLANPNLNEITEIFLGPKFQPEDIQDVQFAPKEGIVLVRLSNNSNEEPEARIKRVQPDFKGLLAFQLDGNTVFGAVVTIKGDEDESEGKPTFLSRFFPPAYGVNEDPVTGMGHTILTPYWTRQLQKEGKILAGRQASARGGDVRCQLLGDRVRMSGQGRVMIDSRLNLSH